MEYVTLLHLPLAAGAVELIQTLPLLQSTRSLHLAVGLNDKNFREAAVNLLYTYSSLKMEEKFWYHCGVSRFKFE